MTTCLVNVILHVTSCLGWYVSDFPTVNDCFRNGSTSFHNYCVSVLLACNSYSFSVGLSAILFLSFFISFLVGNLPYGRTSPSLPFFKWSQGRKVINSDLDMPHLRCLYNISMEISRKNLVPT